MSRTFEARVVAVPDCDDTPVSNIVCTLKVTYLPGAILFRLSIRLTDEVTIYLQLEPGRIKSLNRTTTRLDSNRIPCFGVIQQHLGGIRSSAGLHFELESCGDLITPKLFVLDHFDGETRCTFEALASLATAKAFTTYMPPDVLSKAIYQPFYLVYKDVVQSREVDHEKLKGLAHIGRMYKGKGGALYPPSNPASDAAAATVAVSPPPGYGDVEGCCPVLPASQSTASETDATVGVDTPPGYDAERHGLELPPYLQEPRGKHGLGGDKDVLQRPDKKRTRQPGVDGAPQSQTLSTTTGFASNGTFNALEVRFQEQQDRMECLMAYVEALQARVQEQHDEIQDLRSVVAEFQQSVEHLNEQHDKIRSEEETTQDKIVLVDIKADEIIGDVVELQNMMEEVHPEWKDDAERWADDNMPRIVSGYMEEHLEERVAKEVKDIRAEVNRRLRTAFGG